MNRGRVATVAVLVAVMVSAGAAGLAQESAESLEVEAADTASYPEITLTVIAPQELVGTELDQTAFLVAENGIPRDIEVRRLPNQTLQVVLAIDTSGSMQGDPLAAAKLAATAFVERMPAGVEVAVIGFGPTADLVAPLSPVGSGTLAAIDGLNASGETALYDALLAALDQFPATAHARRSLVLLSDGGDTVSTNGLGDATASLLSTDVSFFAVELQSPEYDGEALGVLTETTGARRVPASDPAALGAIYDDIAAQLVNRYEVRYQSEATGPAEIKVIVRHDAVTAQATLTAQMPGPTPAAAVPTRPGPESSQVPVTSAPLPETLVEPGRLAGGWALAVGSVLTFLALAFITVLVITPGPKTPRALQQSAAQAPTESSGVLASLSERATDRAERALDRRGSANGLAAALERAGITLRPGEVLVLMLSAAVTVLALGAVIVGPLVGVLLAVATLGAFRVILTVRTRQRTAAFAEQLEDVLQLLAGSLRSGYGLLQSVDTVAREMPSPSSDEFGRIVIEARLGRDLTDALLALADRVDNQDLEWVVQAIDIHREIGGDLAQVLDSVGSTIRDRNRVARQVKALSAEGRISAYILIGLPFFLAGALAIMNPEYIGELTRGPVGWIMIGISVGLMAIGVAWIRRLVTVVF